MIATFQTESILADEILDKIVIPDISRLLPRDVSFLLC
jgi:hypothetical protein